MFIIRGVAQVVAHLTGGQGAAGSSPVTPTISSVHNVYEVVNTRFFLVPLGVEINAQFYWGKIKSFSMRKTSII